MSNTPTPRTDALRSADNGDPLPVFDEMEKMEGELAAANVEIKRLRRALADAQSIVDEHEAQ